MNVHNSLIVYDAGASVFQNKISDLHYTAIFIFMILLIFFNGTQILYLRDVGEADDEGDEADEEDEQLLPLPQQEGIFIH